MPEIRRLRRAGGEALRLLVDLLPSDAWPAPEAGFDGASGGGPVSDRDEELCIVFADVAGYSTFVAETGDDTAVAVLGVLDGLVEAALAGTQCARVVKRLGDGLMIAVDTPTDALRIATSLVHGFDDQMRARQWPLRLRAGAHRGTCRRLGDDYFGYHVNLAARVAEAAGGGQALATPHALAGVDLDEAGFRARPAGDLVAKGVPQQVALFAVVSVHHRSRARRAAS